MIKTTTIETKICDICGKEVKDKFAYETESCSVVLKSLVLNVWYGRPDISDDICWDCSKAFVDLWRKLKNSGKGV